MYTLIFGIVWTTLALAGLAAFSQQPAFADQSSVFRIVLTLMPFAGILPIRHGLRRIRRTRSVRREDGPSGPVFSWTDFDGRKRRDTADPRPAWDAEDRDFSD